MKSIWKYFGVLLYWAAWPLLWLYFRRSTRTRIIIEAENQVLLLQPWLGTLAWGLPGGGLHAHEDPRLGALREIREETGLVITASQLKELSCGTAHVHGFRFAYVGYSVKLPKLIAVSPKLPEILYAQWVPVAELHSCKLDGDAAAILREWQQRR